MLLETPRAQALPAWGSGKETSNKSGGLVWGPTPFSSCLSLPLDIGHIKTKLDKISEKLQSIQTESKLGSGEVEPWIWP